MQIGTAAPVFCGPIPYTLPIPYFDSIFRTSISPLVLFGEVSLKSETRPFSDESSFRGQQVYLEAEPHLI